jgi:hypothetical protein
MSSDKNPTKDGHKTTPNTNINRQHPTNSTLVGIGHRSEFVSGVGCSFTSLTTDDRPHAFIVTDPILSSIALHS